MLGRSIRRWTWALACAFILTLLGAAPSWAGSPCGQSGYSYSGIQASAPGRGVSATVTMLSTPLVETGHVAAWVGVGGYGLGAGNVDEWLQVGFSGFPGGVSELYYEVTLPGQEPRYVTLATDVRAGGRHRIAVREIVSRPNWWQVEVNGRRRSRAFHLPGSHQAWQPVVTGESWDGGFPACNSYSYLFERVSVARMDGSWAALLAGSPLEDPGYRVIPRGPANFLARGGIL